MKRLLLAAFCAGLLLSAAADPRAEKEVIRTMQNWTRAMMKKDRAALEKLLHPDLTYGHSSGLIETKAQALESVVNGRANYDSFDLPDAVVRVYGNTAMVTGKVNMTQTTDGKTAPVNLVVLHVFMKGPQGWQMVARQATRPAPAP